MDASQTWAVRLAGEQRLAGLSHHRDHLRAVLGGRARACVPDVSRLGLRSHVNVCILRLLLEIVFNCIVNVERDPRYFTESRSKAEQALGFEGYPLSFYFMLDILACVSMVFDMPWLLALFETCEMPQCVIRSGVCECVVVVVVKRSSLRLVYEHRC